MAIIKKISCSLTFKCICSIMMGAGIVTLFVFLLAVYGAGKEFKTVQVAKHNIEFPENEKMLNNMAYKLAQDGSQLAKISPAAGDVLK